jgi:hypothetical protein
MGLFGGKDKDKEDKKAGKPREKARIELREDYGRVMLPSGKKGPVITSREYRIFKRKEDKKKTWYEYLANASAKFITVSPDKETRKDIEKAIAFTGMKITPDSPMSLFVTVLLVFVIGGVAFIIGNSSAWIGGIIFIAIGFAAAYWLLRYPMHVLKKMRIEASSQIVLAILYMVVSMRISPNLEGALNFAASNVSGALAWDMRRLLWDIEMRKYYSINDAIEAYIVKWKPENEEFAEALRLIRDSTKQTTDRAKTELDEALNIILEGTKTRMKHYAQDLRTPVMVIHMMGIVLPILGTIMAPLAAVFMSDLVSPIHFIVGYDIALPIIIIWFINNTLSKRPMTFSPVDVSKHPDLPKPGYFRMGGKDIPALPIAILVLLFIIIIPVFYFINNPDLLAMGVGGRTEFNVTSLTMSALLIVGIGFGIATYYTLSNFQRIRIMSRIQSVEGEFELALLQLGNHISAGTPSELAVEKSIEDLKDMEIAGLFRITLRNIRNLGMTFENALFDKQYGALKHYPSSMIKNVMYTVVDTSKKGVSYAADSMLRIAKYLKNIRETQEYIRDMLSETASSMKFQAYMLTPLITGLIVSMADIIVQVLAGLGVYLDKINIGDTMGMGNIGEVFGNMNASISPEVFQLIIGIYLIEILAILAMFINKISVGENKMSMQYEMGKILFIGITMYFLIAIASSTVFGELIRGALEGILI